MGYFLLPFRFHIVRNRELLVNDLGDYLSLPRGSVQRIVDRQIRPDEELYKDLIASFLSANAHCLDYSIRWQFDWLLAKLFSTILRRYIYSY